MPTHLGLSRLSDIDLRLLRIYKTVVEAGGFAAAEVELNISRAAISMAMGDLETRLGMRLCQRGRAGFSVTDSGQQVYEAILQLFTSIEGFRTRVNALHDQLKGDLNIGIADNLVTLPHMKITHALRELKLKASDIGINISMMPPNEIEKAVLDGRLNVGVIPCLRQIAELAYIPLYDEESRLYCSHQHPLFSIAEQQEVISLVASYDAVAPAYAQTAQTKSRYLDLNTTSTATDREGVAFLIMTGCFIGYLPTHYAAQWIQQGKMKALCAGHFHYTTDYTVIHKKNAPTNQLAETWIKELAQF
ncbi:MAG: LysR family transcriptional regulator [Gammaproteobacteria bacterium]|nr:LysR family transcriptional regulator [Gammaproteobacteria bacterium]